jgi:LDH2 family malate/lactate/ureidoglycolate dehydrogenase
LEENESHQADVLFEAELTGQPSHGLRAAPPMQAGAPVGSPGDSAARLRAANGFEIELSLWSELNGPAQSNSSVAGAYAL